MRTRLGLPRLRVAQIQLRFVQRDLRGGEFGPGNFAGVKALLQQLHNFFLRGKFLLQQTGAASGDFEIQQTGADAAADLPRGGNKIPRADSETFSASARRLPRLPAVSIGRSNVTGTSHGL